jgi:hypothetical protein
VVRHGATSVTFDWGSQNRPAIQWAAFYSDCEHEVLEVTAGHRVTLTYNLYAVRGQGMLAGKNSVLDRTSLPMYQTIKGFFDNPEWLKSGKASPTPTRLLGFYLR